jgi:hypothetical protein
MAALGLAASALCVSAQASDSITFKLLRLKGYGVQWMKPRPDGQMHLTYAVLSRDKDRPGSINCTKMTAPDELMKASKISDTAFKGAITDAFAMWHRVTNLAFTEISDADAADIVIGAQGIPEGWAFADVHFDEKAEGTTKPILKSAVCLNPTHHWKVGFDGNLFSYDLRYTIAHEIGHAIGLDHPSATGQLMSYRYDEKQSGLQQGDADGVIALYGRRPIDHAATTDVKPAPVPALAAAARTPG